MPLTTSAPADVYRSVVWHLREAGIPYLVGGTYALEHHAGLVRDTKDLDLFVRRADWSRIEETLAPQGMRCELVFSHWLGKARGNGHFVDLIFAGGNGLVEVDDDWLRARRAVGRARSAGAPGRRRGDDLVEGVRDGARALRRRRRRRTSCASPRRELDWVRLMRRFGPHPAVLLSHLRALPVRLSRTIASRFPHWVMDELWRRSRAPRAGCRSGFAAAR